jgi:predicted NUDIX family phosphoesterase
LIDELARYLKLIPQKRKGEYKIPGENRKIIFKDHHAQIIESVPTKGKLSREAFTLMHFKDYLSEPDREEMVLTIDTGRIPKDVPIYTSPDDIDFTFLPKGFAEQNGTFRQLIPYMAVMNSEAELLVYTRDKEEGEERLHGFRSIGVGGHVNYLDYGGDLKEAVLDGLKREIKEELGVDAKSFEIKPLYFYQDDSSDVALVHICAAFIGTVLGTIRKVPKKYKFVKIDEIKPEQLEGWSKILLEEVKRMTYGDKAQEDSN